MKVYFSLSLSVSLSLFLSASLSVSRSLMFVFVVPDECRSYPISLCLCGWRHLWCFFAWWCASSAVVKDCSLGDAPRQRGSPRKNTASATFPSGHFCPHSCRSGARAIRPASHQRGFWPYPSFLLPRSTVSLIKTWRAKMAPDDHVWRHSRLENFLENGQVAFSRAALKEIPLGKPY